MVDVQSLADERNLALDKVGVKNVRYPLSVLDKFSKTQHTTATVDLYANLPHHFKGTHMSRFIEVFNRYHTDLTMPRFLKMVDDLRETVDAERAFAQVSFPYFVEKTAPVTGNRSMLDYRCHYIGESTQAGDAFIVGVDVPVQTLCPCSREISDRGAHNQRGTVSVRGQIGPFFWFEDLIADIEACASGGLYTLLKREDEKYVTEHAYDHPVFVEDLVRNVVGAVEEKYGFHWFSVEAENNESIHNHDAYAAIERGVKRQV